MHKFGYVLSAPGYGPVVSVPVPKEPPSDKPKVIRAEQGENFTNFAHTAFGMIS